MVKFLFILLFSLQAFADISVELVIDRNEVSLEDEVEMRVEVSGSRKAQPPQVAGLEAFEIASQGTSSQVQIVNTTMEVKSITQYTLYPKSSGNFILGPAVVEVEGKKYTSNTAKLSVAKGQSQSAADSRALYIKQSVDNKAPYVNEQVVYIFKLFSRVPITNAKLSSPDFKGFWKENLGEQKETTELIDGVEWSVTEIKTALFPLAGGVLTIPESSLIADVVVRARGNRGDSMIEEFFGGFQRTRRVRVVSEPVELRVQDLPPAAPAGFGGLVGKFEARSQLSRREVPAGESISLTVTVEGSGNIRDLQIPFAAPADLKVYPDQAKTEVGPQGNRIIGKKVFSWALIPLKEGALEIPMQQVPYFDPKSKSYQSLNLGLPPLTVLPGEGQNPNLVSSTPDLMKKNIEVRGEDLMPLKRGAIVRIDQPKEPEWFLALTLFLACPAGYGALRFWKRRRERYLGDPRIRRRSRALQKFRNGLKELHGNNGGQNGSGANEASRLLREYLGDKGNFDGGSLTSSEAALRLKSLRLSSTSLDEIRAFLSQCESAQWGGGQAVSTDQLRSQLESLVKKLEKEASR